jgi:hypothetical protein
MDDLEINGVKFPAGVAIRSRIEKLKELGIDIDQFMPDDKDPEEFKRRLTEYYKEFVKPTLG